MYIIQYDIIYRVYSISTTSILTGILTHTIDYTLYDLSVYASDLVYKNTH
jgi:hypothetical protein